jgi:hypothetical protein
VRTVGLDLLPGAGEVQPRCSCPDFAEPCKHSAAVCYLVADELDRDPFLLFLLRGKGREELLSGIRQRRGSGRSEASGPGPDLDVAAGGGWEDDAGVAAHEAWAQPEGSSPQAVALPAPPRHAGRPPLVLDAAPPGSGVDTAALIALAADAANRAWALATEEGLSGLELTFEEDCARRGASMLDAIPSPVGFDELARRAGIGRRDLLLRALAWRTGGRGGLAALVESWDPAPADIAPGLAALGPGARVSGNRITLTDRQLRLGRDGRWYSYRKVRGAWQPDGDGAVVPDGSRRG